MIHPAELAGCCPAASERRTPTLARARAAVEAGQARASRVALLGHLIMRRVAERWRGPWLPDRFARRFRAELALPGGGGAEAACLLAIVDALGATDGCGPLTTAIAEYARYLERENLPTEALLALERLLAGLPAFGSTREAAALTLEVARLNVTVARWDEAISALDLADATDDETRRAGQLIRAAAHAGAGRMVAARECIAAVPMRSEDAAPSESIGLAWMALGATLEGQRCGLEALQAYHHALEQVRSEWSRRRVLVALGGLLAELGADFAARQAFTLALAGPIPFADQVAARIELLDLAVQLGDRVAFERQRRELAARQEQLPAAAAVEFLIRAAHGLAQFGQDQRALGLLDDAQALAHQHELHEAWFRVERLRTQSRRGTLRRTTLPAAALPLPWETPEIAHVAATLDRQVESLAGSA